MSGVHHERVYVLTGASRGLGLATAQVLAAQGGRVVLGSRDAGRLAEAVATIGDPAVAVVGDNADAGTPAVLFDRAIGEWGRLDGLLVSVGGPPGGAALTTDDDAWRQAFDSVFLGAVRLAREAAARMAEGGSIAFVLSSSVREPIAGLAISNGLRPGLAMVAKTLADELGPRGIRVNGLLPGRFATDRMAELDAATGDAEAAKARTVARIPLGRYGEPAEFGRAAAFLLGPESSFVTGAMLPVDGGLLRAL